MGSKIVRFQPAWYAVSPVYVESRTEKFLAIACPWKKLIAHLKMSD